MSRIDDQGKLSEAQQKAIEKYVREHPGSTLLKDERTAHYIQRVFDDRNKPQAKPSEIESHARREEKYGHADWGQFEDIGHDWPGLTKVPAKHPPQALWNALEEFVRLPASKPEDFGKRYPAFLPSWFYALPCGNDAEPNRTTGLRAGRAWHMLLSEAWRSGFHPEYVAQLVNIPTVPPGNTRFEIQSVCDAQRAVLAMALESWRARFCPKCGRPFVARRAANKFCSADCFAEHRREKQRASKRYRAGKRTRRNQRSGSGATGR
jgi:hypothetical protein